MRILITGASKGIGRSIAEELAPEVTAMVLVARSADLLAEVAASVQSNDRTDLQVSAVATDITDEAEVKALIADVDKNLGGLDVLVNCAGLAIPETSIRETSLQVWEDIFAVNVTAPFLLTKESIPLLRRSPQASIVNIASTAGTSARPGWGAYAASKAALVNFSNSMSEELKPDGIAVHCVAPGRTATELRTLLAPDEDPSTIMQPSAVAKIVKFLVTSDAQVLKGQTIVVRGE
jgi:NAD(P)-dependent dehydrogenase (short-subunit alcohol dehydrogenase family)